MIDFNKPESIFQSLLAAFDDRDILHDLRIYEFYTGDFEEPINNFGSFGFLPIAGTSTGDSLGLTPILGKSSEEWPVLRFSIFGDGAKIVSSKLSSFPASAVVSAIQSIDSIHSDKIEILESKKEILILANILGDDTLAKGIIEFLENVKEKEPIVSKLSLYNLAEGKTWFLEFLNVYKKVFVEDENSIKNWKAYLKNYPFVTPAWELLFLAQKNFGEEAFDTAWRIATSEIYFNNSIFNLAEKNKKFFEIDISKGKNSQMLSENSVRLEACAYISESDRGHGRPELEAIIREAEEKDAGKFWLNAGDALISKKKAFDAYRAYINAGHHYYNETNKFSPASAKGALNAAKLIGDPVIAFALESLGDRIIG
ncbi:MAG: hypothetical protein L6Q54_15035 [Leptospiraceae bacterium]|nr:hypothetical protein [Leptospiraceae bacterium]MCK6382548.1 hypothetical protein [Leptospiraceae bacterium]NUM41591.1 hypothetical protein [Leptospiraceae bacterium]